MASFLNRYKNIIHISLALIMVFNSFAYTAPVSASFQETKNLNEIAQLDSLSAPQIYTDPQSQLIQQVLGDVIGSQQRYLEFGLIETTAVSHPTTPHLQQPNQRPFPSNNTSSLSLPLNTTNNPTIPQPPLPQNSVASLFTEQSATLSLADLETLVEENQVVKENPIKQQITNTPISDESIIEEPETQIEPVTIVQEEPSETAVSQNTDPNFLSNRTTIEKTYQQEAFPSQSNSVNLIPSAPAPLQLAPRIEAEQSTTVPYVFFYNTVSFDYISGTVTLASTPDGLGELYTDDEVYIEVTRPDGSTTFYYNSYIGVTGIDITPPIPITHLFLPGTNQVSISLIDQIGPSRGASGYYLTEGAGGCIDTSPPLVGPVYLQQTGRLNSLGGTQGYAIVTAEAQDANLVSLTLIFNGQEYVMQDIGGGQFKIAVPYPIGQDNTYAISAIDGCGNSKEFPTISEYGSESETFGSLPCDKYCGYQWPSTDPVNTHNGNFYHQETDITVLGVGDTNLMVARTYNAQAVRWTGATEMRYEEDGEDLIREPKKEPPQYFGVGWTFPYATYLLEIEANPFYSGVQIQYADGHTAQFTKDGDNYVPDSPINFDTLTKDGDEFVLHHKYTLVKERFDSNGRLLSRTDRNGNQINLTYNGDLLTRVENDSGRWLQFTYNGDGLIETITAPEGKSVSYGYTDGLLTSFTDARGHTTDYDYNDEGLLTTITTPEGHTSLQQTYDDEYRVIWQQIGRAEINEFTYGDNETRITDSYDNHTDYIYNDLGQIIRIVDARGLTKEFDYNDNYNRTYFKDEEGREWYWTFDDRGNRLTEDGPLGWHQAWSYNDLNLVTSIEDTLDRITTFAYSEEGNLERITRPDDAFSQIFYNSRGLPTDIYDFALNYTENEYHPVTGDLIRSWDGEAYLTQYAYDDLGRLTETTLPTGNVWSYEYDGNDNVTAVNGPLSYQLTYTYDDNNNIIEETDPNGGTITYEYDESEMLVRMENQLDFLTIYTYDDMNNLIQLEDAEERIWTYEYDAVYNRIVEHAPEDTTTLWTYDGVNNITDESQCRTTYENGACADALTTHYVYDDLDRLIRMVDNYDPNAGETVDTNVTTEFDYDLIGNLLFLTDPADNITQYGYDVLDRLIRLEDAENQVTQYGYDEMGNVTHIEDAEEREWLYEYDGVYNRIAEHAPEDTYTLWTYNGVQNVVDEVRCLSTLVEGSCDTNQVRHHEYDALERLVRETANYDTNQPASADTNVTTEYAYDLNGNLLVLTDANTNPTTYQYDETHRLTQVEDAENQVTRFGYDDVDNLTQLVNPRTFTETYTYDGLDRLTSLTDTDEQTWAYTYDRLSNLVDEIDPLGVVIHYDYDPINRPIALIQNYVAGGDATVDQNVTTGFAYDVVGNVRFVYDARGTYQTEYQYDDVYRRIAIIDAEDEVTEFAYDRVSNLVQITDANDHPTRISYDDLNRRLSVTNPELHTVHFAYDRLSNLVTLTDARAYSTTFTYDGMNRVALVEDALDGEWVYTYDPMGNLLQHVDANGHANDTYTYDAVYRLLSMTDAEGYVTSFTYDPNGNQLTLIDGNGHVTHYTYDRVDRVATMTNAENETTQYQYDPLSNQTHLIEADGIVTRYHYDPLYRLVTVNQNDQPNQPESADVNVDTHYGYDEVGNLLTITDAEVHTTTFSYDGLNRVIQEVDADGHTWQYGYDPVGNRILRLDANGYHTTYSYYPDNQLQQIDYELDNTSVTYTYDPNNNRLTMDDWLGTTIWTYDPLNRVTNVVDPHAYTLAYGYDAVGNRTSLTYADGRTVNYGYYDNNWLYTVTDPEANVTTYERDGVGLPTLTTNPNDTISTATYDRANRLLTLINEQVVGAQKTNSAFTYTYNEVGHRTQMVAEYGWRQPSLVTSDYTYDGLRRLVRDEDSEGVWTDYTFDRVGNRLSLTTNDDSTSPRPFDEQALAYSYSPTNRLLTITGDTHPGQPNTKRQDNVAQALHAFQHEVSAQQGKHIESTAAQNLLLMVNMLIDDLENNPPPNVNQTANAIDDLRQQVVDDRANGLIDSDGITNSLLVKLNKAGSANDGITGDLQTQTFSYDNNGNRVNHEYPGPQGPQIQGTDYTYDPENRLIVALDYQMNLQGNRVDRAITTLDYDGGGRRLVKTYDPNEGSGGAKRVEYVFDGLDPVAEYNQWNPQYENFYRGDANRIITMHHFPSGTQGQMYWYHYDGLGSVSGLTKHQGQSHHNYRYEPYGQIEMPPGNFTDPHNHYTFTGKEWDENTGLHYFGARHYDAITGVWMSQDTYRGEVFEPRSLYRYQYVYNNPAIYVDHYGYYAGDSNLDKLVKYLKSREYLEKLGEMTRSQLLSPFHAFVQLDFAIRNFGVVPELPIPGSSQKGNLGYADLVNLRTGEIWEVKPWWHYDNSTLRQDAHLQCQRYIDNYSSYAKKGRPQPNRTVKINNVLSVQYSSRGDAGMLYYRPIIDKEAFLQEVRLGSALAITAIMIIGLLEPSPAEEAVTIPATIKAWELWINGLSNSQYLLFR